MTLTSLRRYGEPTRQSQPIEMARSCLLKPRRLPFLGELGLQRSSKRARYVERRNSEERAPHQVAPSVSQP